MSCPQRVSPEIRRANCSFQNVPFVKRLVVILDDPFMIAGLVRIVGLCAAQSNQAPPAF